MYGLTFKKDKLSNYLHNNYIFDCDFQKPSTCPYCGINNDAIVKSIHHDSVDKKETIVIFVVFECTGCQKRYFATYTLKDHITEFCNTFPMPSTELQSTELATLSPRFVETYNQCLRAESINDLNIAAIGMRSALEILVKDYAIIELKEPKETVSSKSLYQAISDYLKEDDLIKPADVVRILGNDHTHYQRKYPEHDYKLLKSYMDIFINLIETKLKIHHPPVSR